MKSLRSIEDDFELFPDSVIQDTASVQQESGAVRTAAQVKSKRIFGAHVSSKTIFIPLCPQLFSRLTKDPGHFCFFESPDIFTKRRNANRVKKICNIIFLFFKNSVVFYHSQDKHRT